MQQWPKSKHWFAITIIKCRTSVNLCVSNDLIAKTKSITPIELQESNSTKPYTDRKSHLSTTTEEREREKKKKKRKSNSPLNEIYIYIYIYMFD